jgi:hypothetical protein
MTQDPRKGGPSVADRIAAREEACDKILALLADKPRTVAELMAELSLTDSTVCRYMNYLAEMGEACRCEERGPANRQIWRLGSDGAPPDKKPHGNAFSGAKVVPARQVGMHRHPQDVAFFGPARGAAS